MYAAKDAQIVAALKEQVEKLKKLAQVKTEIVFEEKRLREALNTEQVVSRRLRTELFEN